MGTNTKIGTYYSISTVGEEGVLMILKGENKIVEIKRIIYPFSIFVYLLNQFCCFLYGYTRELIRYISLLRHPYPPIIQHQKYCIECQTKSKI